MATLLGEWQGEMRTGGGPMNMVFTFERNAAGEFVGTVQDAGPARMPMLDLSMENNELFFRLPQVGAEYRGTLVNGSFIGRMKAGAQDMTLNVIKGDSTAGEIALALTETDYEKLAGEWTGTLAPPGAPSEITFIMIINRDDAGVITGTFQSPQQGNTLRKITSVSLAGNILSMEIAAPLVKFTGELAASSITGTWTRDTVSLPLKLTKK